MSVSELDLGECVTERETGAHIFYVADPQNHLNTLGAVMNHDICVYLLITYVSSAGFSETFFFV